MYVCVYIPLLYVNEKQEKVKEVALALEYALGRIMLSERAAGSKLVPVSRSKIPLQLGKGRDISSPGGNPESL